MLGMRVLCGSITVWVMAIMPSSHASEYTVRLRRGQFPIRFPVTVRP